MRATACIIPFSAGKYHTELGAHHRYYSTQRMPVVQFAENTKKPVIFLCISHVTLKFGKKLLFTGDFDTKQTCHACM